MTSCVDLLYLLPYILLHPLSYPFWTYYIMAIGEVLPAVCVIAAIYFGIKWFMSPSKPLLLSQEYLS